MNNLNSLLNIWDVENDCYRNQFTLHFQELECFLLENPLIKEVKILLDIVDLRMNLEFDVIFTVFSSNSLGMKELNSPTENRYLHLLVSRDVILNKQLKLKLEIDTLSIKNIKNTKTSDSTRDLLFQKLSNSFFIKTSSSNKHGATIYQIGEIHSSKKYLTVAKRNFTEYNKIIEVLSRLSPEVSNNLSLFKFYPIIDKHFESKIKGKMLMKFSSEIEEEEKHE